MSIIELYPTKSASQWTQFSGVKLKMFISYQRLKTLKHLVRLALFCSDFSFYEHFNPFERERFIYGYPPHLNADISYVVYCCCFMRYRSKVSYLIKVRKPKIWGFTIFSKARFWVTSRHFSDCLFFVL